MNVGKGVLGPAGCWIAHKRLETWAKLAKERTKDSSGSTDSETEPVSEKLCFPTISNILKKIHDKIHQNANSELVRFHIQIYKFHTIFSVMHILSLHVDIQSKEEIIFFVQTVIFWVKMGFVKMGFKVFIPSVMFSI